VRKSDYKFEGNLLVDRYSDKMRSNSGGIEYPDWERFVLDPGFRSTPHLVYTASGCRNFTASWIFFESLTLKSRKSGLKVLCVNDLGIRIRLSATVAATCFCFRRPRPGIG